MTDETPSSNRDIWKGIGLSILIFWIAPMILWLPVFWVMTRMMTNSFSRTSAVPWGMQFLPVLSWLTGPLLYIAALIIAKRKQRPGIFKGLLMGLAIMIGLGLLLAVACFGLVFVMSGRR